MAVIALMVVTIMITALPLGALTPPEAFCILESREEQSTEAGLHVESFLFPGCADKGAFTALCLFPYLYSGDISVLASW